MDQIGIILILDRTNNTYNVKAAKKVLIYRKEKKKYLLWYYQ